ncbi:MAG: hypothetical protein AAF647_00785 [Pseudomonadota bacterium]
MSEARKPPIAWPTPWLVSALGFAGQGLLFATLMFSRDEGQEVFRNAGTGVIAYFAFVSALGAFCGGAAVWKLMGHAGRRGVLWSLIGAVLATALGGAIGGTLTVPGMGTIAAPFLIFGSMAEVPWLGAVWLILTFAVHWAVWSSRGRERAA